MSQISTHTGIQNQESLSEHLRSLELSLLNPAVRVDRAQVSALLTENFQEFGSSGKVWTRDQVLDVLATETFQPLSIGNFNCRLIAERVALVTYRGVRTDPQNNPLTTTLRSSLWIEEMGKWRMCFHQGTPTL